MTTPISDLNAFYGKYISKKEKAVPLPIAKQIEREMYEESAKCRVALGGIARAHSELDAPDISRNQVNTLQFPLSLSGRRRNTASTIFDILQEGYRVLHPALSTGRMRISPAEFYNYKSKMFLKNKRKGY